MSSVYAPWYTQSLVFVGHIPDPADDLDTIIATTLDEVVEDILDVRADDIDLHHDEISVFYRTTRNAVDGHDPSDMFYLFRLDEHTGWLVFYADDEDELREWNSDVTVFPTLALAFDHRKKAGIYYTVGVLEYQGEMDARDLIQEWLREHKDSRQLDLHSFFDVTKKNNVA